jgi:ubiquinone/menaquinone biosynthesis C-methylase UbiE
MTPRDLNDLANEVGDDWAENAYYEEAEEGFWIQWRDDIWPVIQDSDFTCTVELAAGRGRNSERLRQLAAKLYLVDMNAENIAWLSERFSGVNNIVLIENDGLHLSGVADEEATFVYSFDSMVHFDSDVVRQYLREFSRVLKPGGAGFCHYSNYSANPTGSYRDHPAWRNFMSIPLFEHYAAKEGLEPTYSAPLMWQPAPDRAPEPLDGLTLFRKP